MFVRLRLNQRCGMESEFSTAPGLDLIQPAQCKHGFLNEFLNLGIKFQSGQRRQGIGNKSAGILPRRRGQRSVIAG